MIKRIESRDNKLLKVARSLHKKKGRVQTGLYFAEGLRLVKEALSYVPAEIDAVIMSEEFIDQNIALAEEVESKISNVFVVSQKLFAELCDTETPQGIAALVKIPKEEAVDLTSAKYVLILDGVSEPGNMGTIIRTAEAAGIDLICLLEGCVDVYSPKTVRSGMGSLFRMKVISVGTSFIEELKKNDFTVIATALYNSVPIEEIKASGKRAIVIGNEARGVSEEVLSLADIAARIEMSGSVESLNAAVAAGIAMYMLRT